LSTTPKVDRELHFLKLICGRKDPGIADRAFPGGLESSENPQLAGAIG
jgi:hypothetical protein